MIGRSLRFVLPIFMILSICSVSAQQSEFLVGHWSFDEGEGDVVEDKSGQGNDGTITGEVEWIEGQLNSAVEFTAGANVEIADSDVLRDMDGYTVAMWVMLNELAPAWNHLFEKDGSYAMTVNTAGGDFRFTPNSSKVWFESKYKVDLGEWYYIAMTSDGSTSTFYVDGQKVQEAEEPVVFNTNPINIGHVAPYTVNGAVDEVKFWATVLTEDEIVVSMKGDLAITSPSESLLATWASVKSE